MLQRPDGKWKRDGKEELMVTQSSAKLNAPLETRIPCQDDHSRIAKVMPGEEGVWYNIIGKMKEAVQGPAHLAPKQLSLPTRPAHESPDESSTVHTQKTLVPLDVATPGSDHKHISDVRNKETKPAPLLQIELCSAVEAGNVNKVQTLMAEGARVHTSHERKVGVQKDPFLLAALCKREEVLEILIRYGPDLTKCSLHGENTALHLVFYGRRGVQGPVTTSLIALLLRSGLDLEARNNMGMTPLLVAAAESTMRGVRCLLGHGADLGAIDDSGYGVLHRAANNDRQLQVMVLLNVKGAPLELEDNYGATPIAIGAKNGAKGIVEYLFGRGVNIGATATRRTTPLIYSSVGGHVKIAQFLLDQGAKISEADSVNRTAIHFAAWFGHPEVLDLLISTRSSVAIDHQSLKEETPLLLSAQRPGRSESCAQCAKLLLRAGARTDIRDGTGFTALHHAAKYGSVQVLKELLTSGADKEAQINTNGNADNSRALHLAKFYAHPHVVKILLESGADPFAQDRSLRKPSVIGWAEEGKDGAHRTPSEEKKAQCMKLLAEAEKAWMESSGKSLEDWRKRTRNLGYSKGSMHFRDRR